MRNYIILNGKNSNEINGLLIQELPPISKPLIRTEVEEIDGRDGDIVTPLGYSAYDKELTIGLYKDFDVNEVAAYFNSEGTVIFSNEPDKYYYYQITAQIDFERLVRYRTATVTMHCQPFKYSATEQPITEDVSGTVSDEGTNLALENTAEAPFNQFDLKSNTVQDGTPTPSAPVPVKAVTGLNRVKINGKNMLTFGGENISGTSNGVTYNYNATTQEWTFDGTASARTNINYPTDAETTMRLKSGVRYTATGFYLGGTINGTVSMFQQDSTHGWNGISLNMTSASTTSASTTPAADLTLADSHIIRIESGTVLSNFKIKYQVEASQNATDWEAYQGQIYEVNLGKNLFDKSTATLGYRFGGDGAPFADATCAASDYIPIKASTKYTYSRGASGSSAACICYYDSSKTFISRTMPIISHQTATSGSVTSPSGAAYARIADLKTLLDSMQLELGGSATSYSAYFTPITLCTFDGLEDKIYKSGDKWYLHKEIGVADLSAFTYTVVVNILRRTTDITDMKYVASNTQVGKALADNYIVRQGSGMSSQSLAGYMAVDTAAFAVNVGTSDTSVNPTGMLYYELATPTDTEITNEALIAQLDDIYYHAHAYKGRTHINSSAATGNVPHIIAAEVGEDNESTITNAGNYLSKPKITVYGSGDISLYINDMHVLQITLGDEGYITIDTAQMEAYKDTLDNLKNRLVIGDYSNARLKPGANKIHFTGTVTKYVVENYSRWL